MDITLMLQMLTLWLHLITVTGTVCTKLKVIGTESSKNEPDKVDSNSKTSFMVRDPKYGVPCCGVITKWTVFIKKSGTLHFQVWRDQGTGSYKFIGDNQATYHPGEEENTYTVIVDNGHEIPVKKGDYIGWYSSGKSMPGYTNSKKGFGALSAILKAGFDVGDTVDWSKGQVSKPRIYGLSASVTKGSPPKFKNLDADITISDDTPAGSIIYSLTFVGFQTGFLPYNYFVVMDTITDYFYYNSTLNTIYLTEQPPVDKFVIDILVKDHCETSSKGKLKVTISSQTPHILNLPSSAFVREDLHRLEILLKELNVTYRENVVCVIQKVEPTKAVTYFTIRAIPDNEFVYGVYIKPMAELDYDTRDLYIISVKCSEGKASDTQNLYVYVTANKAPVFVNVPGSFYVDAKTANVADSVYQVNATDEENDVIKHTLVCDSVTPCPFNITKDGTVFLQTSLNRTISKIVFLNITLEDNFNQVGPRILIANVTNFNRPPYIEDATSVVVTLYENTPEGYSLYAVNAHDPDDDDVITFSLDVRPSKTRQYFTINETTGIISSAASVDFEGVKFKVSKLIVSVTDGKDKSSTFLKVALIDQNEPPAFMFGSYSMHIPEGDPKAKNDLRIKAKDSDKGGSFTFGIECENGTDAFQINDNTGVVSQVLHIDIDKLNVSEQIIECNITATDKGGLSSYAQLTIVVEDINDNSPVFLKTSFMFVVSESLPVYGEVGNAQAVDIDTSPENNQIFYEISDEKDDFIIDENGTIYMMKDITTVPFGSVFKYNVTAEDRDKLSDMVPVTIVVIANIDPNLLSAGFEFLSLPENVVWTISAAYLVLVALGIMAFLLTYYLRCFILRRGRRVHDSQSSQSRRSSVHSVLSARMYNNVFDKNLNRDGIVLSPVSNLRCASIPKTATSIRRTDSLIPQQITVDSFVKKNTNLTIQQKENMDKSHESKQQENIDTDMPFSRNQTVTKDKDAINRSNESNAVNENTRSANRQSTPYQRTTPCPRVMSVGCESVTSELPLSPTLFQPSKPNTWSKCSLSDISPTASGSWKPWSVNDFQKHFET